MMNYIWRMVTANAQFKYLLFAFSFEFRLKAFIRFTASRGRAGRALWDFTHDFEQTKFVTNSHRATKSHTIKKFDLTIRALTLHDWPAHTVRLCTNPVHCFSHLMHRWTNRVADVRSCVCGWNRFGSFTKSGGAHTTSQLPVSILLLPTLFFLKY